MVAGVIMDHDERPKITDNHKLAKEFVSDIFNFINIDQAFDNSQK